MPYSTIILEYFVFVFLLVNFYLKEYHKDQVGLFSPEYKIFNKRL